MRYPDSTLLIPTAELEYSGLSFQTTQEKRFAYLDRAGRPGLVAQPLIGAGTYAIAGSEWSIF